MSILMPAYNAEKFIGETLDCLISQAYRNIEIIVVNDGSTDNTCSIVEDYAYRDSRIKVFHQQNLNAARARNRAFAESHGEYVMYMDADDLISKYKIQNQIDIAIENDDFALVNSQWVEFHRLSEIDEKKAMNRNIVINKDYDNPINLLFDMAETGGYFQTSCWLIPRKLHESIGLWNPDITINDDGVFFAKALTLSSKVFFCKDVFVYYRRGHESYSTRDIYSEKKLDALYKSYVQILNILSNYDDGVHKGMRNFNLILLKSKYNTPIFKKAKNLIVGYGFKPVHPFPSSKSGIISKIIGFNLFLWIKSVIQRISR